MKNKKKNNNNKMRRTIEKKKKRTTKETILNLRISLDPKRLMGNENIEPNRLDSK